MSEQFFLWWKEDFTPHILAYVLLMDMAAAAEKIPAK